MYENLAHTFMSLLDLAIIAIRHDKENDHEPGTPHVRHPIIPPFTILLECFDKCASNRIV